MATNHFDVIVLGVGGMGAAACFELARRGRRVLGLEQFALCHDQGSSHGHTRIIRTAYFEHPSYVPLLRRAWDGWYELERLRGVHLLTECGCLSIGRPDGSLVPGIIQSARQYGLPIDVLNAEALRERYPQFRFGDDYVGVFEKQAGFLYVDKCVRAHVVTARLGGAVIRSRERVLRWEANGNYVSVVTTKAIYRAAKLIVTAGPWAGRFLAEHGASLRVMKQTPLWFGTADDRAFQRDRFPVYIAEVPEGNFYGFPVIDTWGHKVAQHYGAPELASPTQIKRVRETDEDEVKLCGFLSEHVPLVNGPVRRAQVCIYTLSPDRHFIIDTHPEHPNVAIAAGFSGHGYKFAPVIGEIMADLAEKGCTDLPIDMFRISRFGDAAPTPG